METKIIKGVPTTRDQAVLQNIKLVRKLANRYTEVARYAGLDEDDLLSVGAIGLMLAFDDFDDTRGLQFSTYAVSKIMGEITRTVRNGHDKGIRHPVHVKEAASKISRCNLFDEPIPIIAEKINASEVTVKSALEYMKKGNPKRLDDFAPDKRNQGIGRPIYELVGEEMDLSGVIVKDFLDLLPEREQVAVKILMDGGSNGDVAKVWGVTSARVWFKMREVKSKLHRYLEDKKVTPAYK